MAPRFIVNRTPLPGDIYIARYKQSILHHRYGNRYGIFIIFEIFMKQLIMWSNSQSCTIRWSKLCPEKTSVPISCIPVPFCY